MIVDEMKNFNAYRNLAPAVWDKVVEFVQRAATINEKHREELMGDKLFAMVQFYESKNPAAMQLETHRQYADIHILLDGGETMYYQKPELCTIVTPYNADNDAEMSTTPLAGATKIEAPVGTFVIFFADEPHAPQLGLPAHPVKKIVVKIHRDWFK